MRYSNKWKSFSFYRDALGIASRETISHVRAIHLYPFGHHHPAAEKGVTHPTHGVNKNPVLLVHGVVHNRSAFFSLKKEMELWGWTNIFTMNYPTWHGSLTGMIEDMANRVESLLAETGASQVDIVAHSLGGLVARYYMSIGGGRGRVRQLVTLGTAHRGTHLSGVLRFFLGGSLHRDLKRHSYFIKSLNQVSIPRKSRIISIYSKKDRIVWPYTNCLLDEESGDNFKNMEVDSAGHISLLYDKSVFLKIHDLLLDSYKGEERSSKGKEQPLWTDELEEDAL